MRTLNEPGPSGHRQRMWVRFAKGGLRGAFVHDYEKLEFLLTLAIPRKDTKPLAKSLLARFGSLPAVFTAKPEKLREVPGVGARTAHLINLFHEVALVLAEEALCDRDLLNSTAVVKGFLLRELAHEEAEHLYTIYLDRQHRLIRMGRLFRGTLAETPSYPREIVKAALACNAAGVIIAHNHPSGLAEPSDADMIATQALGKALATVDIQLLDHFVVGRGQVTSMVACGYFASSP